MSPGGPRGCRDVGVMRLTAAGRSAVHSPPRLASTFSSQDLNLSPAR